ncbi:hypothetical protein HFP89_11135 [Wenzhouxiangella sp. XN79A]|nr:hypothetical protein [Wenzhouxiangella sp. XN79A]
MHTTFRRPLRAASLLASLSLLATGCASTVGPSAERSPASTGAEPPETANLSAPPTADRQAILSMVGEFGVTFAFDETVPLAQGYETREPKRSGAAEAVILVEDSGDRIVLQHLLLMGTDGVIKHWRQDWVWQADSRFEFTDDQTWTLVPLDEDETRGQWTQCVYEVSDAPRYCGTGDWNHRYGSATWTSDRTWRPLPRREYTTREDYTALNVENRHTITPTGWTHEQDNSKVVRVDGETRDVLVREFGFNHYIRTDRTDFSPVYDYWDDTAAFWAQVRNVWSDRLGSGAVVLDTDVDGMPIIEGLFELADAVRDGQAVGRDRIDDVFDQYVIARNTRLANR